MTIIKKAPLMAYGIGLGLMSIMVFNSFKNAGSDPIELKNQASLYWYPVDASTGTTTAAAAYHNTKSVVVSLQSCKDVATKPICLYGTTDPSFPIGDPIGTPTDSFRILRSN